MKKVIIMKIKKRIIFYGEHYNKINLETDNKNNNIIEECKEKK